MTTNELYNDVSKAKEIALTQFEKYKKPRVIASFIEMIISIVCIVGINFIVIGLDFSKLLKWQFWILTAVETVGIFFLFRAVINARFEKTANRPNVVEAREKYNALNKEKKLDLKVFLKEYNRNNKIMAYTHKIAQKMAKLDNQIMKSINPEKQAKLELQLEHYKELISDEYIEEHIDRLKVKYFIVYYNDFFNENSSSSKMYVSTRRSWKKAFNKSSFNKMWMFVLITGLLALAVTDTSRVSATQVFAKSCASIFMIVVRIVSAIIEADFIYDSTITQNMLDKTEILEQYYEWQSQRPLQQEPSEREKELAKIREELEEEYKEKLNNEISNIKKELSNRFDISIN